MSAFGKRAGPMRPTLISLSSTVGAQQRLSWFTGANKNSVPFLCILSVYCTYGLTDHLSFLSLLLHCTFAHVTVHSPLLVYIAAYHRLCFSPSLGVKCVLKKRSNMATDNDYEVLEKIGQGSFGVIRKVRRKGDGEVLCRKEISYTRMSDREKEQLHAELRILESLRHPNIVQYCHRQHLKSSHDLHLYMEYCGNGDLGGYIRKLKDKNCLADESFIWSILAQLVAALYRCHYGEDPPPPGKESGIRKGRALMSKQGHTVILHRDLKPENGGLLFPPL